MKINVYRSLTKMTSAKAVILLKPYRKTLFSLLFILFFLLPGSIISAQTSIPVEITDDGHILVKAKINGVLGNFIFDTGGGLTLITEKFSRKLDKLHKQDGGYTAFRATGEKISLDLYDVESLTVGDHTEDSPILTIYDADFGPIDGLISLMSFKHQPVTIDFQNKKLVFETTASLSAIKRTGKSIPLQLGASRDKSLDIFAYFTVNDKLNLQFLIDSGAGNDVYKINADYLPAFGIDPSDSSKVSTTDKRSEFDAAFSTKIYNTNIQSIKATSAHGIQAENVKASFIQGLIYDGVVSLNWIGKRVTIDIKKEEMVIN